MTAQPFYQEEPKKPFDNWRTYTIGIPVLSSALGACLFMFLAFSFTELSSIPDVWRVRLVVVAALAAAAGSAFGSIGSSVEVYAKAFEKRAEFLDWVSLALSVLASLGGFVLGFAALLGSGSEWVESVTLWGPIVLSILVAGDAASDVIQLGGIFGAYNLRYAAWDQARREWNEAHHITEPVALKPAKMQDLRRAVGKMNGDWSEPTEPTVAQLADALRLDGYEFSSESTGTRWARLVRQGKVN